MLSRLYSLLNPPKKSGAIAKNRLEIIIRQEREEQKTGLNEKLPEFKNELIHLFKKYFMIHEQSLNKLNVSIRKDILDNGVPVIGISIELPPEIRE